MQNNLPLINSHNSWSPLEEVWLGDVYPADWYDHLKPDVRDVFYELTAITQHDLNAIQKKLTDLGICVRRPLIQKIENYLEFGQLRKPPIMPRDTNVVVGNMLFQVDTPDTSWDHIISEYLCDSRCCKRTSSYQFINGANVVRAGLDIVVDTDVFDRKYFESIKEFNGYRVTLESNGGHLDACFAILRPGLILATHYYDKYEQNFPGWEVIRLDDPKFNAYPYTGFQQPYPLINEKFWDTTVGANKAFNDHVIQHALDWVGCYTETYFELNCLVIDESNVVMLAENAVLAEELHSRGITVHWVPFRARSFWDGAMHCLTVDIRRQSRIEDFFPEKSRCV